MVTGLLTEGTEFKRIPQNGHPPAPRVRNVARPKSGQGVALPPFTLNAPGAPKPALFDGPAALATLAGTQSQAPEASVKRNSRSHVAMDSAEGRLALQ